MCGIAGVVSVRPGAFRAAVQAMLDAMTHRGPDDEGLAVLEPPDVTGTVVLGSRRLAILDRSPAGHQPMQDPQRRHWIVYNGEVYNFAELRAGLGATGVPWTSSGDTEALLRAYGAAGVETLTRWRGMFAVAIWDAQRQALILARDRLGIKPLYYWQGDGVVAFASEVRALLASGLLPRRLSTSGLATFLSFGAVQDPLTLIEGIEALLPGHRMIVQGGSLTMERYWDLPPADGVASMDRLRIVDALCDRLQESTRLHLVSDVPLGLFLSGGVDSSLLAALAQRGGGRRVATWTVAFQAPGADEGPQAAAVARAIGSDHHEVPVDPAALQRQLPEALRAMDQPTINGLNTYAVARAVHEAGLTVVLSGLGGDELFAGYPTFRRSRWCQAVPAGVRRLLAALAAGADPREDRRERWRLLGAWERDLGHPLLGLRMVFGPQGIARLLGSGQDSLDGLWGAFAPVARRLVQTTAGYDAVTRVSALELRLYMVNMLLRDTDGMSMAHSVEARVPYLDHPFVEWALTVPGRAKVGHGPKPLLAAALRRLLPSVAIPAVKRGFVVPLARWLREPGPLQTQVEASFHETAGWARIGLRPEAAGAVWRAFERGRCGWAQPWALVVLRWWVEAYGR